MGCACFEAGGARKRFRTGLDFDSDIGVLANLAVFIIGDADGAGANALGIVQPANHVGRATAGSDAAHNIVLV